MSNDAFETTDLFDTVQAVVNNWHYKRGDDNMAELGEELIKHIESAEFNMILK